MIEGKSRKVKIVYIEVAAESRSRSSNLRVMEPCSQGLSSSRFPGARGRQEDDRPWNEVVRGGSPKLTAKVY